MNEPLNQKPSVNSQKPDGRTAKVNVPSTTRTASASKDSGLFSKISDRFNNALQNSRGSGDMPAQRTPLAQRPVEDVSLSRIRSNKTQKMHIPEGVVIKGSISGRADAEIHGRIEGDVSVEAALFLGRNALVTGNVRAGSCQVEGAVKGSIDCTDDLILTANGRLASNATAGKQIRIAGSVEGNVSTPGVLRVEAGGVVNGDVQARVFSMSEGAELNGRCTMRVPEKQETLFTPHEKGDSK